MRNPAPASHAAERAPIRRRRLPRLVAAAGITTLVAAAVVGAIGPSPSDDGPAVLGPESASALVETVDGDGHTEVRFLDPTADPARIAAELEGLGVDLEVIFVAADPFSAGRLVFSEGTGDIDLLGDGGSELAGGPVGIRVPDDWSGSGQMAIGRNAEDGEVFETTVALNADRAGGPLHCNPVRGMDPDEAALVADEAGLQVEWRTTTGDVTTTDEPPTDFVVQDALWHATDTVLLFAAAGDAVPLPESVTADCDGR